MIDFRTVPMIAAGFAAVALLSAPLAAAPAADAMAKPHDAMAKNDAMAKGDAMAKPKTKAKTKKSDAMATDAMAAPKK